MLAPPLQFDVLISRETNQTLVKLNPSKYLKADLYPNLYWGVNSPLVLIVLPVVNFLVIPCFPKLTIRARIGIGLLLYLVGNIAMVVIHAAPLATHATVTGVQLGCMLIPVTIFAIAEVLTVVSGINLHTVYTNPHTTCVHNIMHTVYHIPIY